MTQREIPSSTVLATKITFDAGQSTEWEGKQILPRGLIAKTLMMGHQSLESDYVSLPTLKFERSSFSFQQCYMSVCARIIPLLFTRRIFAPNWSAVSHSISSQTRASLLIYFIFVLGPRIPSTNALLTDTSCRFSLIEISDSRGSDSRWSTLPHKLEFPRERIYI